MTNNTVTIDGLPANVGLSGSELLEISNSGTSQRTTTQAVSRLTIPSGGTSGQVLAKLSGTSYDLGWANAAGGGTVTSVALSGGTTGLTVSGSPITGSGTFTLGGTLGVANGGTGQSSFTDGQLLIGNSSTGLLSKATLTAGSNVTITNGNGTITIASTGGGGGLTIGSTTITSGTTTRVLYDNAGTLGEYTISGSGSVAMTTSPTFTTPALGTPSSATLTNATGLPISTGVSGLGTGVATALAAAVSGSGSIALTTSPTFTTPALGTPSSATLTNATGLPVSTGISGLGTGVATALAAGVTGSGNIALATSPTFTTPVLGAATGTSLSVTGALTAFSGTAIPAGGTSGSGLKFSSTSNYGVFFGSGAPTLSAAQGSIYLRSDGTSSTGVYTNTDGATTWSAVGGAGGSPGGSNTQLQYNNTGSFAGAAGLTTDGTNLTLGSSSQLLWSTDLILTRNAAAVLQQGAADAASPVAQTLQVQSVSSGTSNASGQDWTLAGSKPTNAGTSGNIVLSTSFTSPTAAATTFTITIASPGVVTQTGHGYVRGQKVVPTTSGALPTGLTAGTTYYVIPVAGSTSTYQLATSLANAISGTAINTSGTQSGTHTMTTTATTQNDVLPVATWGPSGLTGSQATSLLDIKQTWNTSGTPSAIKLNTTDVASNTFSLLMDLQVNGTTKGSIDKLGTFYSPSIGAAGASATRGAIAAGSPSSTQSKILLGDFGASGWAAIQSSNNTMFCFGASGFTVGNSAFIGFSSNQYPGFNAISNDVYLTRSAAASLQMGAADAATAVAQTLRVQSVASGNSNVPGANWTQIGSLSTGSGASGDIIFQTGDTGAAATTVNTARTALTIKGGTASGLSGSVVLNSAAIATNATDGFLYITSCAGAPSGTPTTFTGRVPIIIDTTNSKLMAYIGGAWKGVTLA